MVDLPNLVASAIENDRSNFSAAVLLSNNSRTVKRIREILTQEDEVGHSYIILQG